MYAHALLSSICGLWVQTLVAAVKVSDYEYAQIGSDAALMRSRS